MKNKIILLSMLLTLNLCSVQYEIEVKKDDDLQAEVIRFEKFPLFCEFLQTLGLTEIEYGKLDVKYLDISFPKGLTRDNYVKSFKDVAAGFAYFLKNS